ASLTVETSTYQIPLQESEAQEGVREALDARRNATLNISDASASALNLNASATLTAPLLTSQLDVSASFELIGEEETVDTAKAAAFTFNQAMRQLELTLKRVNVSKEEVAMAQMAVDVAHASVNLQSRLRTPLMKQMSNQFA